MVVMVTGGSGSGKSEYAETLAVSLEGSRHIYIATMRPWDEEGLHRINRHRVMRAGKGFETVEWYLDLEKLDVAASTDVVLLECMSNLTANEFYRDKEKAGERILKGIRKLIDTCRHLIIVSNEVFSDGNYYDGETMEYRELLGNLNCQLAAMADQVTEVVYKVPVVMKGGGKD